MVFAVKHTTLTVTSPVGIVAVTGSDKSGLAENPGQANFNYGEYLIMNN
jgi:hypothetical protein